MRQYHAINEDGEPEMINHRVMQYARKMKIENPNFDEFRTAGRCPMCKASPMISFICHPDTYRVYHGVEYQDCGHWCPFCRWSGATFRTTLDKKEHE